MQSLRFSPRSSVSQPNAFENSPVDLMRVRAGHNGETVDGHHYRQIKDALLQDPETAPIVERLGVDTVLSALFNNLDKTAEEVLSTLNAQASHAPGPETPTPALPTSGGAQLGAASDSRLQRVERQLNGIRIQEGMPTPDWAQRVQVRIKEFIADKPGIQQQTALLGANGNQTFAEALTDAHKMRHSAFKVLSLLVDKAIKAGQLDSLEAFQAQDADWDEQSEALNSVRFQEIPPGLDWTAVVSPQLTKLLAGMETGFLRGAQTLGSTGVSDFIGALLKPQNASKSPIAVMESLLSEHFKS